MKLAPAKSYTSSKRKYRSAVICIFCVCIGIYLGWKNVPGFIKANLVLLGKSRFIDALTEKNDLETLHLDIPFKSVQKIESKRKEALEKGRLISSDDDFVSARITKNSKTSRCKIRLKGDLSDHWSGDKFSLRVEMKGSDLMMGMSRFSLQDPVTRNNTAEWLFLQTLAKEQCMSVRYHFVNLIINGKKMGIYAMEEHFSKELIEANQRREGVIVRFEDYLLWKKFPVDLAPNIEWNSIFRSSYPTARNNKRIKGSSMLENQKVTALNLLRSLQENKMPASKIFDAIKLGKFLAITRIWQAERGLLFADINFYFNPVTCLLEPIGFDGNPKLSKESPYCYFSHGDIKDNWVNFALSDPSIAKNYIHFLYEFSQKSYWKNLKSEFNGIEKKLKHLLCRELFNKSPARIWKNYLNLITYDPWNIIESRTSAILNELSETQIIRVFGKPSEHEGMLEITIQNTTTQQVELIGFSWDETPIIEDDISFVKINGKIVLSDAKRPILLHGQGSGWEQTNNSCQVHIRNNLKFPERMLYAMVRLWGLSNSVLKVPVLIEQTFFEPSFLPMNQIESSSQNFPEFIKDHNNSLLVPKGRHFCDTNIYVPNNKTIYFAPGSTIIFAKDSIMVCSGIVKMIGTKEKPIILTSQDSSWGGILLVNVSKQSDFENVLINKVSGVGKGPNPNGLERNGWTMTGGISIYNSNVSFKNCSFEGFSTEDALNIISSTFVLEHCSFNDVFSDAFDGDFVSGEISNCKFSNINGDGVDFSGSVSTIKDSIFENIADKAVSVGENSQVEVKNCDIDTVSFGIVSKDSSRTIVRAGTSVKNAKTAAFSAFQKKNSFGPATIKVEKAAVSSCTRDFLIQNGSMGFNNNTRLPTTSFESNDLYKDQRNPSKN